MFGTEGSERCPDDLVPTPWLLQILYPDDELLYANVCSEMC